MKILKFTSGLLWLILLNSLPAAGQNPDNESAGTAGQNEADLGQEGRGSRVRGPRIGVDLASLVLLYFEPERMIYTISVDYEAWQDIYPVIETGYQHVRITKDIYSYSSSGLFVRAGADINVMKYERTDVYEMIYAGLRFGYSNFYQRADDILLREDYFGDITDASIPGRRLSANWIAAVGGIRVELFKNFFIGWSVEGNVMIYQEGERGMTPYNIPGFGPGGKRAGLVIKYSLAYRFPLQHYHPRKIVKRSDK
jgi:hypothetical protein